MYDIAASASAEAFMSPPPAGRRMWIDLARGIGVILVVFGHMQSGLVNAGLFPSWGGGGLVALLAL